jgi:hypothetical protein
MEITIPLPSLTLLGGIVIGFILGALSMFSFIIYQMTKGRSR